MRCHSCRCLLPWFIMFLHDCTPFGTPEDLGVRFGGVGSCHFSLLPSLLPCSLPPISSLSLTGDTLKWIPEIAPLLFPLWLHADRFFIIFRCSSKRVKIFWNQCIYQVYSPWLVMSASSILPPIHIPYLCPYLSCGTFQSHPSFSIIDFFIPSMSGLPSASPPVTPTSLYTVLYSYSTSSAQPALPLSLPELQRLAGLLRNKSTSHAATSQ